MLSFFEGQTAQEAPFTERFKQLMWAGGSLTRPFSNNYSVRCWKVFQVVRCIFQLHKVTLNRYKVIITDPTAMDKRIQAQRNTVCFSVFTSFGPPFAPFLKAC
jgi:hypothetical protein